MPSSTKIKKLLIVEDDTTFSGILSKFLEKNSYQTCSVTTISKGLREIISEKYDLLLLDYRLPDGTAIDLMSNASFQKTRVPVIIMTTFNDIRIAVKTMKLGAKDYITKPVHPDELLMSIEEIFEKRDARPVQKSDNKREGIKGISDLALQMQDHVELVAPTDLSVLIQGESGTGKEYVARNIHQLSKRSDGPFVAVDCGALSSELAGSELFGHVKGAFTNAIRDKKGDFEEAHGGTLLLDEIGNLNYENQIKLLRAIQEKTIQPIGSNERIEVNVRLITATNEELFEMVKAGKFREDLYHRINEFKIQVPSLRERYDDLDLLIQHFITESNESLHKQIKGMTKKVRDIFLKYSWPGNLRELKNIIKRSVLLSEKAFVGVDSLPEEMLSSLNKDPEATSNTDLKSFQKKHEKVLILQTLEKVRHNKTKAARLLNIDRKTLYNKLSQYNI